MYKNSFADSCYVCGKFVFLFVNFFLQNVWIVMAASLSY